MKSFPNILNLNYVKLNYCLQPPVTLIPNNILHYFPLHRRWGTGHSQPEHGNKETKSDATVN